MKFTEKQEKKKIIKNMVKENNLVNIVPVIVFGLGFLLRSIIVNDEAIKLTIPYLLLALLLGTIIPYIIMYNNFENCDLSKLIISETLLFSSEACSFSLLISCALIPYLHM